MKETEYGTFALDLDKEFEPIDLDEFESEDDGIYEMAVHSLNYFGQ